MTEFNGVNGRMKFTMVEYWSGVVVGDKCRTPDAEELVNDGVRERGFGVKHFGKLKSSAREEWGPVVIRFGGWWFWWRSWWKKLPVFGTGLPLRKVRSG